MCTPSCSSIVFLLTICCPLVSLLPGPPSSIQHLDTFPALHHKLGSSDSVVLFPFMEVSVQTGQPIFKVSVPVYGLGQVPILLPPALTASPTLGWNQREQTAAAQSDGTAIQSGAPWIWCLNQHQSTRCFVGYWPAKIEGQQLTASLLKLSWYCQDSQVWQHWICTLCRV